MIVQFSADAVYLYASPQCELITGFTPDQIVGQSITTLTHPDDLQVLRQALDAREPITLLLRFQHADGDYRWLKTRLWPTPIEGRQETIGLLGNVTEQERYDTQLQLLQATVRQSHDAITLFRDSSEEKRARDALEASEQKYRDLFESASQGLVVVDGAGLIRLVNRKAEEMFEYLHSELIGQSIELLLPLELHDIHRQHRAEYLEDPRTREMGHGLDVTAIRKDGSIFPVEVGLSYTRRGEAIEIVCLVTDITGRKAAENALREEREFATALAESISAVASGMLDFNAVLKNILDHVGRVVPHDAAHIMLAESHLARFVYWHGYGPDYDSYFAEREFSISEVPTLREMYFHQRPFLASTRQDLPDYPWPKDLDWVQSYLGIPLKLRDQVVGFLTLHSATPGFFTQKHAERLRAFAAEAAIAMENASLYKTLQLHAVELEDRVIERTMELYRTKSHLESVLDASQDAIAVTNTEGVILQTNPAFDHLLKGDLQAAPDWFMLSIRDIADDASRETFDRTWSEMLAKREPRRIEIPLSRVDGSLFDADLALSPIRNGDLWGVICSIRDITPRKQIEEELRRTLQHERELRAMKAKFISMVSHEFRTPLAVIMTSNDILTRYAEKLSEQRRAEHHGKIMDAIRHLTTLTDDISFLNKTEGAQQLRLERSDIASLFETIASEIGAAMKVNDRLRIEILGKPRSARTDAKLFRQIITNLVTNAIKYSPAGGEVLTQITFDADTLHLRVQDHGIGIPESDQPYLFDAFHRASNVGEIEGSGLGLHITKRAVELLGGSITCQSEEGQGTTFDVSLPLVDEEI